MTAWPSKSSTLAESTGDWPFRLSTMMVSLPGDCAAMLVQRRNRLGRRKNCLAIKNHHLYDDGNKCMNPNVSEGFIGDSSMVQVIRMPVAWWTLLKWCSEKNRTRSPLRLWQKIGLSSNPDIKEWISIHCKPNKQQRWPGRLCHLTASMPYHKHT